MAALPFTIRRDRAAVVAGLAVVVALAWAYLLAVAAAMDGGSAMDAAISQSRPWRAVELLATFGMWAVMMVAMMLPGALPMILMFATINRRKKESGAPSVPTAVFALGYAAAWTAFSLVATVLQWQLHALSLLSPMMASTSALLGAGLFFLAGVYQWTPWKRACLRNCRSPIGFVLHRWRDGNRGALSMGLEHGLYCVGCCWVLMALLFVGGVMNLLWVAAIAITVLAEKALPRGRAIANAGGGALVAVSVYFLFRGIAG